MKRYNAVKLQLHEDEWDNADLLSFLYPKLSVEEAIEGNESGDGIFWYDTEFEPLNHELFKYSHCFDWILNKNGNDGNSKLWYNGEKVTISNYRTAVYIGDGEEMRLDHYDCINWEEMTDINPNPTEELNELI